jgi:hypothetical protein
LALRINVAHPGVPLNQCCVEKIAKSFFDSIIQQRTKKRELRIRRFVPLSDMARLPPL